jgi:hypothetical protein
MSEPAGRRTGRFSYDVATDKWQWDDEVYRIHGLMPGEVEPTTSHVLGAPTPEDAVRIKGLLDEMVATTEPFSVSYRVSQEGGADRFVLLVGERALCDDDPEKVTSIEGFLVDLTADVAKEAVEAANEAVQASAENRAVIEQAKGALMLAYGFDEDAAFAMLVWWSRTRNVKVRDLARQLMRASEEGAATGQDFRSRVDDLLHDLSHQRPGGAEPRARS